MPPTLLLGLTFSTVRTRYNPLKLRNWGRLLTAMLTPFGVDGQVNIAEARRIAAHLVDIHQNDGVVIAGTTGEGPTLTHGEKLTLLSAVLEEIGDRASVIMGAGTYNTAESVQISREAQTMGATGIMLVNPYYNRPGQEGLYAHFRTVAESVDLPVMLYNIAPRSAINLETPTLIRLVHDVPNIIAVKEASGSLTQIQEVCAAVPSGFLVYSGDDSLTLPILSVGGIGVVSVVGHVAGKGIQTMLDAYPHDAERALKEHRRLLPLVRAAFSAPSPVPVKYMLSTFGFDCDSVRLPLVPLSEPEKNLMRNALNDYASA